MSGMSRLLMFWRGLIGIGVMLQALQSGRSRIENGLRLAGALDIMLGSIRKYTEVHLYRYSRLLSSELKHFIKWYYSRMIRMRHQSQSMLSSESIKDSRQMERNNSVNGTIDTR